MSQCTPNTLARRDNRRAVPEASSPYARSTCREGVKSGFSLIEVLIASLLLMMVILGVLPLFVRSIGLNHEGRFATKASHFAASEIERMGALPFNAPELTIPVDDVETSSVAFQTEPFGPWLDESEWDIDDGFLFHRITRVRQFGLVAISDGILQRTEAINGSVALTTPGLVQLKEIVVQVESGSFPGAASKSVTLRSIRGI